MIKNALIAIYILVVLAISAIARAGVLPNNATQGDEIYSSESKNYNFKTHVGTLSVTADGYLMLIINQQKSLILQSQNDLTSYIGSKVMISGIEIDQQVDPSYEVDSKDPLPRITSGNNEALFYVFGIAEVR